eukprot:TRINITY_DN12066_c0_g1_i3.p1 TRINITY_DN12066_c0_g1~~TRINITY_DN12066_c0_g1_i3.p1  ORF type:complete len:221 (+),score=30.03 TRINITY_DN12066_c0_g1_i3:472-1134(+)
MVQTQYREASAHQTMMACTGEAESKNRATVIVDALFGSTTDEALCAFDQSDETRGLGATEIANDDHFEHNSAGARGSQICANMASVSVVHQGPQEAIEWMIGLETVGPDQHAFTTEGDPIPPDNAAPELVEGMLDGDHCHPDGTERAKQQADAWQLGCTFYYASEGVRFSMSQLVDLELEHFKWSETVMSECYQRLLVEYPQKRATAEADHGLLRHLWGL